MKNIGVITNKDKDGDLAYTSVLVESIARHGGKVRICGNAAGKLGIQNENLDENDVVNLSEMLICLGGDGTFLRVARKAFRKKLPMLGINLGSLGFLTEVDKNDIDDAVKRLFKGEYKIEERMMLDVSVNCNGKTIAEDTAFNDIVISRGALSKIIHVKTYINEMFVDNYPSDGLIISTPTGATAYSLAAGGPIVEPDVDMIIVTPICPHILYARSIITTGDRKVKAVVGENYEHEAMVTVDGQEGYAVRGGDCIVVKKSEHSVKVVRIYSRNHFNVLRRKIYDRGECLRKNEI